jgi:hypothetical protein
LFERTSEKNVMLTDCLESGAAEKYTADELKL